VHLFVPTLGHAGMRLSVAHETAQARPTRSHATSLYTHCDTTHRANFNFSRSEASGGIAAAPMLVARLHARSMTPKHGRVHRSLRPMCSKVVG
jgi:hypothetical protein